jgi:hypothetical protein
MNDYNNGEIWGWNGGDCPVHPESFLEFWLRGLVSVEDYAGRARWTHKEGSSDIIAFRVVEPYVEPKTIWVNEYVERDHAYPTEEEAKRLAGEAAIRIAVEYREVKK